MRTFAVALLLTLSSVAAFTSTHLSTSRVDGLTPAFAYVPDGFTPASYKKFKEAEAKKNAKKSNLGSMGPKGFQSRSMQSFQEALERGEAAHLLPVFDAKKRVASGELREEDIPYMQRGGSWDNTDVKGAKKVKWLASDKEYATGGFRKEQSVSIFGYGGGLDWTGKKAPSGPSQNVKSAAPKFAKNYKAPKVKDLKAAAATEQPKKKGFFGLF
mmetsp:Transcript_9330/g.12375  ORF Transcript_9330/g.12375 Transcript_9330/m.12375 type:complete len:214 (+) Transcript_9330:135-776(+)|eukprot:CAMPEP_0198144110 /NCGR_PEP_ID=MMETSP1443-20131203/13184_1 /TAXON_ID=186043 /ORGANISM="Entomoneis sp., Strain CCMP2396" /LENGTH=213 /DNA_ID=CAMNT_0043807453 /DNA_START=56 /DNA_END=697 /DNA_ORIENTATION=-